jgi:uncharacterized protein (DUF1499 family)
MAMLACLAVMASSAWTAIVTYKTPMLTPCPASPNCVSSDSSDDHSIAALRFSGPAEKAWQAAKEALLSLPRTHIVGETGNTLHAECKSAVFGFVDDVDFELRSDQGIIAVRSASRVGYSDLGVNRRRIEAVRTVFDRLMAKS